MPFQRIAIVNRGERAMRFVNAVAELNRAGGERMTTIALSTEPDRRAWFVREADEAVCIGPATTFDERASRAVPAYLDHDRLERALVATGADAAWARGFDDVHSINRALDVGSVDRIIPAAALRPHLVGALERGMARIVGSVG
jgi:biotin carboxylase